MKNPLSSHPDLTVSIIEHNLSAQRGFLNNPKWYIYGHRLKYKS